MRNFAVIGLGRFGQEIARALTASGAEVIAIDRDVKLVERLRDEVTLAVRLDATDEEALRAQGIHEVDAVIVGIGHDFESSALTVATLAGLEVRRIIARAESETQAKILSNIGADEVALPERESAMRWAHRLSLPDLGRYIELGEAHAVIQTAAPRPFHHKTLKELDLRNTFGVNLIAIERRISVQSDPSARAVEQPVVTVPDAETTILPDDMLVVVGSNEALSRLPQE